MLLWHVFDEFSHTWSLIPGGRHAELVSSREGVILAEVDRPTLVAGLHKRQRVLTSSEIHYVTHSRLLSSHWLTAWRNLGLQGGQVPHVLRGNRWLDERTGGILVEAAI